MRNNKINEGELLFANGKIDDAEECFLSILESSPDSKEAYNNLGVIAFGKNDNEKAIDFFTRALEIDPLYRDTIVNYTNLLRTLDQLPIAIPFLEKITEENPLDKELIQLQDDILSILKPTKKIAVICAPGLESFLGDIVDYLETKYEVRTCYSTNVKEIDSAIMWSDIVWLEWANELTVALTSHPGNILKDKHVICRLHSYEALDLNLTKINWEKINDLISVADHIKDIALQQVPNLIDLVNVHIIPNGINLKKFAHKERLKGKNLAFLGNINSKKGPMLLLHAIKDLVQIDNQYRLFIGGNFQDRRYELYFNQMINELELEKYIQIDGWVEDVNTWLEDKQYIVCTSVLEGHPVGIMEAMACGLKPLLHNYVGARKSYPDKYIWNTIPEFVKMATEDCYDADEYRNFIDENYSLNKQTKSIDTIITQMCATGMNNPDAVDRKTAEVKACP